MCRNTRPLSNFAPPEDDSMPTTGTIGDAQIQCRVRVTRGNDIAIGPGKMDVLSAIRDAGSISGAARNMGMSYRRAWLLVETMNSCFERPLVETATGGKSGGGARLTPEGEKVLASYSTMMVEINEVADRHLSSLLRHSPLAPAEETLGRPG